MSKIRVSCYIDGFNLYHAIDESNRAQRGAINHLKWVNLRILMEQFTDPAAHAVEDVKLFTAYPTWNKDRDRRHKEYVKALQFFGVEAILGQFKPKDAYCKLCKGTYRAREEKESDVNLAMHMVADAFKDNFDQAFIVTNDSDLLGPIRLIRTNLPGKRIKVIAPPFRRHSKELWSAATHRAQIGRTHLERSVMPETMAHSDGTLLFNRPTEYDPPA